jgi:hypothetical protein
MWKSRRGRPGLSRRPWSASSPGAWLPSVIRPTHWCLAIDDGVRDQAWAFTVTAEQYRTYSAGTLVHAQVDRRRNRLLVIRG